RAGARTGRRTWMPGGARNIRGAWHVRMCGGERTGPSGARRGVSRRRHGRDRGTRRDRRDPLDRPRIAAGYRSRAIDARSRAAAGALEPYRSWLNRSRALAFCSSMILSENRFPSPIGVEDMLFGIMLQRVRRQLRLAVAFDERLEHRERQMLRGEVGRLG